MSDLLQVSDLEKAKLHDKFHSEVITGKVGGLAGGADIDFATNAVTGQVQATMPYMLNQIGGVIAFDFATGGKIELRNEFVQDATDGIWQWTGALPHVVAPSTDPMLDTTWVQIYTRSHASLSDLNPGDGSAHKDEDIMRGTVTLDAALNAVDASLLNLQSSDAAQNSTIAAIQLKNAEQDAEISSIASGQSAGVIGYTTQADLYADLTPIDKTIAYVTNDSTSTKNGVYRKIGASGSGSWAQSDSSIPDSSIQRNKLTLGFAFNGKISNGASLNDLRKDGVYYGDTTNGLTQTPSGFVGPFILYVNEAFDGTATFLVQTLVSFTDPLRQWVSRLNGSGNGRTDWAKVYQNQYMLTKKTLPSGSTQQANEDGIYFLNSANSYTDMPENAPIDDYCLSVNEAYLPSIGQFKNQRIWSSSNPNTAWVRRVNLLGATMQPWTKTYGMPDTISRNQLVKHFADNGSITSGDLKNYTKDGTSVVLDTSLVAGCPLGIGSGVLTTYTAADNSWGFQEFSDLFDGGNKHRRMTRPDAGTVSEWGGMPASGKTIACFGDSITEFGDYPQRLRGLLGANILKMGFGGCRMANHQDPNYNEFSMCNMAATIASGNFTNFLAAAAALKQQGDDNTVAANLVASTNWLSVDYVIILFGTNDYASNVPIGAAGDGDGTTFKGGINKTLNNLLAVYPHLKILFLTPFWRPQIEAGDNKDSDTYPNDIGLFLEQYCEAIVSQSGIYHIASENWYRTIGIGVMTQSQYLGANDDIHPNANGYKYLAEKAAAAWRSRFGR